MNKHLRILLRGLRRLAIVAAVTVAMCAIIIGIGHSLIVAWAVLVALVALFAYWVGLIP